MTLESKNQNLNRVSYVVFYTGISSGKAATFGIGAIQVNFNYRIHILAFVHML